jgi:tetratricopeptide (TPR) repeat protein
LDAWQSSLGPSHPRVGVALTNLAQALRLQDRLDEAERQYERALEILESGGPAAAADRARCLANLAALNQQRGNPTRAVDLYRKAIDAMQDPAEAAMLIARLAEVRRSQGLYAESLRLYRRAIPMLETSGHANAELRAVRVRYDEVLKESARTMLVAK